MIAPIYLLSAKDNACVKVADPLPSSCYLRPESVKSGLTDPTCYLDHKTLGERLSGSGQAKPRVV